MIKYTMLCKTFVINLSIENLVIRYTKNKFKWIKIENYIENNDSIYGNGSY